MVGLNCCVILLVSCCKPTLENFTTDWSCSSQNSESFILCYKVKEVETDCFMQRSQGTASFVCLWFPNLRHKASRILVHVKITCCPWTAHHVSPMWWKAARSTSHNWKHFLIWLCLHLIESFHIVFSNLSKKIDNAQCMWLICQAFHLCIVIYHPVFHIKLLAALYGDG